jgi:hypothetical protein
MFESLKEKFNALPMWAKIGGGVLIAAGLVFGAMKIFKKKKYRS